MKSDLRFAFFGTPMVAVWVLEELAAAGMLPAVIITAPDKPAGRGMQLQKPDAKLWAEARGIPVLQPEKLDDAFAVALAAYACDVFLVAAYGKILREDILTLAPHGCLNVHPSLLPKYRGAAPIEAQLLADERDVGVSLMQMDAEMDHGPILAQERVEVIGWPIMRSTLSELLARAGGRLAAAAMPGWVAGTLEAVPQRHEDATYTRKTEKEDGLIDPNGPARENYLKYCAYEGWPGLYFFAEKNGKKIRVKILKARYEDGSFVIEEVIPEGKRATPYAQFVTAL
ncbi:MAG TPA: methionyl-tRNA formyltransferase [Candidatus Paceibacterota bacterium]|jgi:methionyl-tRNA formyltransferase|nr:methionyl-tRNA formyltransferase [Candidatus Paceibacterota bacterium]